MPENTNISLIQAPCFTPQPYQQRQEQRRVWDSLKTPENAQNTAFSVGIAVRCRGHGAVYDAYAFSCFFIDPCIF